MSDEAKQTFEGVMGQLEKLVRRLEGGDVPLDESLQAYGEGLKLVGQAKKMLEGYEMQVEKIIAASGETEPFDS